MGRDMGDGHPVGMRNIQGTGVDGLSRSMAELVYARPVGPGVVGCCVTRTLRVQREIYRERQRDRVTDASVFVRVRRHQASALAAVSTEGLNCVSVTRRSMAWQILPATSTTRV